MASRAMRFARSSLRSRCTAACLPASTPSALLAKHLPRSIRSKIQAVMKKSLLLVVLAALAVVPLAAQAGRNPQRQPDAKYKTPRTPWGDPDLQGIWPGTDFVGVPLQRPASF